MRGGGGFAIATTDQVQLLARSTLDRTFCAQRFRMHLSGQGAPGVTRRGAEVRHVAIAKLRARRLSLPGTSASRLLRRSHERPT